LANPAVTRLQAADAALAKPSARSTSGELSLEPIPELSAPDIFDELMPETTAEDLQRLRQRAEAGHPATQISLGVKYYEGHGVPKSFTEAAHWYRKAAEQHLALAQFLLGDLYARGEGVPKNQTLAVGWYRKAAEQGHRHACLLLADALANGKGVETNLVEAATWFAKRAELGDAKDQYDLGERFWTGADVPKNREEAVIWYRKAALKGYAPAQRALGDRYFSGLGTPQNLAESAKWTLRAANQGYVGAQRALGSMYYAGAGVPRDNLQAYLWFNLAAAQGDSFASSFLDTLGRNMTPSQIAEAQRLSREFQPKVEWAEPPDVRIPESYEELAKEYENEGNSEMAKFARNRAARQRAKLAEGATLPREVPASDTPTPIASGSGFFITTDGYLISNAHVVSGGSSFRVMVADGLKTATVVKRDEANDLALLKVTGQFKALPIVPSRPAKLGQAVATVGFPNIGLQGFSPKLAKGEIASLAGVQDDARHFQISVPVQPGNSGGALVDAKGNVLGVVVAKLSQSAALAASGSLPENVNYAVKSGFLLSFLESVPELAARLPEPGNREEPFEDMIATVQKSAVLVLVYR
jgi:TPR repeat protein